ncbi:threonine--tRNA ligase [Thermomicrobium roseum]|jgi:threonyl-tRNA synthetase|uniref:Threonine--tRNA ligase n=1 Tax=Thermomicrobium roseum (strain ATCC 27502 / DSM 5159 / P-2) TaxID=309801 RepID=B9L0J6_THERP|nr:threonine--tRNA ligase [Thermomicrobium roseum]ACM05629.1 threonyl-tRNA synthetase [Thermomicrobium roseum DSM 5159]MBO9385166.1 threonine--tRNA ligase [Thermomicrobium sp.]
MSDLTKEMDLAVAPESEHELDLARMRHSCAHVMAQAVLELFPGAKLGIGPAIADGFYYDFDLPRPLTPEDLEHIERRMEEIKAAAYPFVRRVVTREEARELFRDQPYKLELIAEFPPDEVITTYTHDGFTDLCRGPHVRDTSQIGFFKLLRVSGAYWRGDERRPQLQRIYGTSWPTREQLDAYLHRLEEAERRDHRRLGRELELFHFDPTAPGMPYWLPKGLKILNLLLDFWRQEHEKRGYQEIAAPLINDKSLWEVSGHWDHYRENMFLIQLDEHLTYGVKPMNCPNAMIVYNLKKRSYRDLPLRLSDCDILHRYERSGTLHGLLRVRKFQQDDAHIFVTEDQIEEEFARILEIAQLFYGIFGLRYTLRLGTRPADFMGDPETWDKAEAALQRILDRHAGPGNYLIGEGEGAFYGPKIDILMEDALGRQWQTGTIQLDFQLPRRFGCTYTDRDGTEKTPVVIHRVIYGSLERFIGILIEHFAGAFPVWLAPVQATIIPIADRHLPYAYRVRDRLRDAGLRVEVDDGDERMQAKIRSAQLQKIPYMLVVGDREVNEESLAVRLRTNENIGSMSIERFITMVQRLVAEKSLELVTDV